MMNSSVPQEPHAFMAEVEAMIREMVTRKDRNPQKPVRQHFVPRTFQKRFRNGEGELWTYHFGSRQLRRSEVGQLGWVNNLYTLPDDDGTGDYKVEHFFGVVEDKSAPALDRVAQGQEVTEEDRFWLCFFWGSAFCRSRDMIRSYQVLLSEVHMRDLRHTISSVEAAQRHLDQHGGEKYGISARELFEFVQSDAYDVEYETHAVVPPLLRLMPHLCQILWDSRVTVLKAPAGESFITADSPVVLMPLGRTQRVGFGLRGTARVMPISCDICLVSHAGRGLRRIEATRDEVRRINMALAYGASEFLLGSNEALLHSLVCATSATNRVWRSSFTVSDL